MKQNNKCNTCGFELEEGKTHVDHIKPKKDGGDDSLNNLQILCIPCHSKKNKKDGVPARYPNYSITSVCGVCGKIIGGYSTNHVNYLMMQHELAKHPKVAQNKPESKKEASEQ